MIFTHLNMWVAVVNTDKLLTIQNCIALVVNTERDVVLKVLYIAVYV